MNKHTPDQWVPIVELPPNPKVPDHYGHISECCGSVLMPPWEYEHARLCVEACTGLTDPAAEIAALRRENRQLLNLKNEESYRVAVLCGQKKDTVEQADQMRAEIDALREAVKVLGAELREKIQEVQDHERHMSGNVYSLSIPSTLLSNPIAAAAVRGEQ